MGRNKNLNNWKQILVKDVNYSFGVGLAGSKVIVSFTLVIDLILFLG